MDAVKIERILPTQIWIENGRSGERSVMLQHEGCAPFAYATFNYDYRYTSNLGTFNAATQLAVALGATIPVEQRAAGMPHEPDFMPKR